jgi:hypothetical protein
MLLVLGAVAQTTPSRSVRVDFESFAAGPLPSDFSAGLTGNGPPGAWEIREDATAPAGRKVLAQTSADKTSYRFPVCVYRGFEARDVELSVRFRALSGEVDQAGGLVARFQDADNYYVVRANALENNVRLYRVVAGRRQQFAGTDHAVARDQWHTLGWEIRGAHHKVFFNGKLLFEADDSTFPKPGPVGVWTKADSVTHFDDLAATRHDTP